MRFLTYFIFIFYINFFPVCVFAQVYSVADCKADFEFLKKLTQQGHGGLYQHISPADFEKRMAEVEKKIKKPMPANTFFKLLTSGFQGLGLDHTSIGMPENYFKDLLMTNSFFPLPLYFMEGKGYLDYDFLEIPLGAELTHIEGVKMHEVIAKILDMDINEVKKGEKSEINFRMLEDNFPFWFFLQYGQKSTFEVEYIAPNTKNTQKIKINAVNSRAINGRKLKIYSKSSDLYTQDIHYKHIDTLKTLLVALNTFQADSTKFVEMWDYLANASEELKIENFVIDLRENLGGNMNIGNLFYGYFIDKPHQDKLVGEIRSRTLLEKKQIVSFNNQPVTEKDFPELEKYLQDNFVDKPNEKGGFVSKGDFGINSVINPRAKTIKGNIYILIGGKTYSTAVNFARLMYNNPSTSRKITFVGEETGSGYYGHTANVMISYRLPKTNLLFEMPIVHVQFPAIKRDIPRKRGLIPQIKISQNINNYLKGRDAVLDHTFKMIKEGKR